MHDCMSSLNALIFFSFFSWLLWFYASLASAACMPRGLYVLLALISFKTNIWAKRTQDLLDRFSPSSYLIVDWQFHHLFPMAQGTLPWQPIVGAKLDYSPLFVTFVFRNGLQYCHSDFKKFICDYLATIIVNLVNFGPVTPEFSQLYSPS